MLQLREYHSAQSLEEAWTLNQKKNNRILGGTGWLRLGTRNVGVGIDLSQLGLDTIQETEEEIFIGAMVTLRRLELHPGVQAATGGAIRESLRHIVGVQFRNCATVGGTIWGRFGFSDPLTCLLALDVDVVLYRAGRIPLTEFVNLPPDGDILTQVVLKKTGRRAAYLTMRNAATDFPVLAVCVTRGEDGYRCAVGARPAKAALVTGSTVEELTERAQTLTYGSNTRGSEEYRRHLAGVLIRRCAAKLEEVPSC